MPPTYVSACSAGGAAAAAGGEEGCDAPLRGANAVFTRAVPDATAKLVLSGGGSDGGSSTPSTPPGQSVEENNWPDSIGQQVTDACDSTMREVKKRAAENKVSHPCSFDKVVEDADWWGESPCSGGRSELLKIRVRESPT